MAINEKHLAINGSKTNRAYQVKQIEATIKSLLVR